MSTSGMEGRLAIAGAARPGLFAQVNAIIEQHAGEILSTDQRSTDAPDPMYFQRVTFRREELTANLPQVEQSLSETLGALGLSWRLVDPTVARRMIILASRSDHCVVELLWRHRRGELDVEIPLVISNHPDLREKVEFFGIEFAHIPTRGVERADVERKILHLTRGMADLLVLARYMQILTPGFLEQAAVPVINIHHSFLPAFVGAAPYRKAWERGVKLIGATAHYVTPELDAGPIIEQDTARIDHSYTVDDLRKRGAYVERAVLSRAVQAHLEDRVFRHGDRTVVFA